MSEITANFNLIKRMTWGNDDKGQRYLLINWMDKSRDELKESEETKNLYQRFIIWLTKQGML